MENNLEQLDGKIIDFYNNSKQVILSENLFYHVIAFLDKEETKYLYTHRVAGSFMLDFLKQNDVQVTPEDEVKIKEQTFYLIFVDNKFEVSHLIFDFTYVSLIVKNESLEVLY